MVPDGVTQILARVGLEGAPRPLFDLDWTGAFELDVAPEVAVAVVRAARGPAAELGWTPLLIPTRDRLLREALTEVEPAQYDPLCRAERHEALAIDVARWFEEPRPVSIRVRLHAWALGSPEVLWRWDDLDRAAHASARGHLHALRGALAFDGAAIGRCADLGRDPEPHRARVELAAALLPGAVAEARAEADAEEAAILAAWPEAAPSGPAEPGIRLGLPVRLVLLPVADVWEVPIRLRFGGFNACPFPSEHAAVLRAWHERHGLAWVEVTHDTIVLDVERPPEDRRAALALARQFGTYNEAHDGFGDARLASGLVNDRLWSFWWD